MVISYLLLKYILTNDLLNVGRRLQGPLARGQAGPCAVLCLSCLTVPYDPIEAKPLCQEEISGVTV